jgi:hypothetical protein
MFQARRHRNPEGGPQGRSRRTSRLRALRLAAAFGALALLYGPATAASASTVLYLKGDGVPLGSLSPAPPVAASLANHDPLRDSRPGLLVARGGDGIDESNPARYQQWIAPATGVTLDGPLSLVLWGSVRDHQSAIRGVVEAFLLGCDPSGADCTLIAENRRDVADWSGGLGSWTEHAIGFGHVTYTVPPDRSLAVRITVAAHSGDDMWFAYDAQDYPSRLTGLLASDIVIDGDVADWLDGDGLEFVVEDEGGPDDWHSPSRLDITRLGVASNLVDAFFILMGFDDVPPKDIEAATLLDTDLDGSANFAVVASVDGPKAAVELYACDDTVAYECEDAVLRRVYPASSFRMATYDGPWDTDTMLEVVVPFGDLGFHGGDAVLTPMVSYAAESLMTSPKDSIFGDAGQLYAGGVYYDTTTGETFLTDPVGPGYLIRRHQDPAAVRTADPYDEVASAPYDDTGSLDNGLTYFYVVEREGGVPARISAHANTAGHAVRLGFDDGDPYNAPVDAVQSEVTVSVESVEADGNAYATVTVVPRDVDGMRIGAGCAVSVDTSLLVPAVQGSPVRDHLDGSYSLRLVSLIEGAALVRVTVDGLALAYQPEVQFTAAGE